MLFCQCTEFNAKGDRRNPGQQQSRRDRDQQHENGSVVPNALVLDWIGESGEPIKRDSGVTKRLEVGGNACDVRQYVLQAGEEHR